MIMGTFPYPIATLEGRIHGDVDSNSNTAPEIIAKVFKSVVAVTPVQSVLRFDYGEPPTPAKVKEKEVSMQTTMGDLENLKSLRVCRPSA